jgi:outer membrane lipoprotein
MRVAVVCALMLTMAACARPPAPLRGTFPPLSIRDAQAGGATGERVRWGGDIVATRPSAQETCFEIVSKPLDSAARPADGDSTEGRFIACAPGFYDPAVYAANRAITVVGTLGEPVTRRVGEYDYRFPLVHAEAVYLWPQPQPREAYPYPYYYDPFYDPFWDPWWGPWWGGGFVVGPGLHGHPHPRPGPHGGGGFRGPGHR